MNLRNTFSRKYMLYLVGQAPVRHCSLVYAMSVILCMFKLIS